MKITLTCCWLPGHDPDADKPFLILRSDRLLDRTVWQDELERLTRASKPEWKPLRVMRGDAPAPVVRSAEIDLDAEAACHYCGRSAPLEYLENGCCPVCESARNSESELALEVAAHWDV